MNLHRSDTDLVAAELERQLRDGIGCLVCRTRFHAPSTDLDGECPVCRAQVERDRLREALEQIVEYVPPTDEDGITLISLGALQSIAREALS